MTLFSLFLAFLRVGLFAVGGAYSFLPLIEKEVVQRYHWLSKEEFLDILGVTQVFPGAISIKYATYTGYKVAGIPGAILANLGNILAPTLLIILASAFYIRQKDSVVFKGAFEAIRICVFAMLVAVAFQAMDIRNLMQLKSLLIITLSFTIFIYTKVHPAIVIILAGIIGAIWR
jgi:chromate transporter